MLSMASLGPRTIVEAKLVPNWAKLDQVGINRLQVRLSSSKVGPSCGQFGIRILGDLRGPKQALGPSQGVQGRTKEAPRRHQGGTREAPRRHQGGTEAAPRNELGVETGPRAHHIKEINHQSI